jgi:hypothetical protein
MRSTLSLPTRVSNKINTRLLLFVAGPTVMETTSSAHYISNGLRELTIYVGMSQRLQMKTSHILTSIHDTKYINTSKLL